MNCMNLTDITTLNIQSVDYSCIITVIIKSEAIKVIQSIDLPEKRRTLQNMKLYYHIYKWANKF